MALSQRLIIQAEETINGFNYAFMKALLTKAYELHSVGGFYKRTPTGENGELNHLGAAILNHLCLQMGNDPGQFCCAEGVVQIAEVASIIEAAGEFLAIFEARD